MPLALIVHGGAWDIPDDEVAPHQQGCLAALRAGWQALEGGGAALDAVEAAVRALEDHPIFDAGVGSVLNRDGVAELDAAIQDGATLRSGAVAAVRRVRNPITLARRVLESEVVLLVAEGAERFAAARGVPLCDPAELVVERERARWEALLRRESYRTEHGFQRPPGAVAGTRGLVSGGTDRELRAESRELRTGSEPQRSSGPWDTVGCVALDAHGNLAAGTSTGGTSLKLPGRVGDSPLIGAGLYADNFTAGASSTGWGESIIKVLLAKTATDLVGAGHHPAEAARRAIEVLAQRVGGLGGLILLDGAGRAGFAFNTPRMAYAYRVQGGEEVVGI
ncbi:MAG TPA: isoaspartyl peptidase/L-asparaginase [Roseiflexaceae bacterium]|nr:isoaspartyl peptidase/L-asparaginase [Roseiflexaceae bacterium]